MNPRAALRPAVLIPLALLVIVTIMSFWTGVVLLAIFGPMILAVVAVVIGVRDGWAPWPWIAGGAFAFIPAVMMVSVTLCRRTGNSCPSEETISSYHKAFVALAALALAFAVMRLMKRDHKRDLIVAALVVVAELWIFWRLKADPDMRIAAAIVILLLIAGVVYEVLRYTRRSPELAPEPS